MDCDRLSGLSDDLILQILSFVGIEDAIKTSVLSPRWRYLWTCIPRLSFSSQDFSTVDNFSNFVTHVLSRRNNQLQLSSFDLYFCGKHCHRPSALKIMNHAFSLNAKQLNIACLIENHESCGRVEFPLSLPGSKTLKHLTLKQPYLPFDQFVLVSSHEFSSLTTLQLHCVTLYDGFLSMCPNLKNLTLHCCKVTKSRDLMICHPRLSNLKLEQRDMSTRTVNVVTPELKNLTILKYNDIFRVSAPKLASLYFKGPCPFIFLADGFPCLEKALLSFRYLGDIHSAYAPAVIGMIQLFHNVKLLSLSKEIIQLLNSSVELFSHRPSPLANLESLRLLPKIFFLHKQKPTNIIMSAEVKNYLLSSSPKATLTEVLGDEML